jgi:hypothetical protein
MTNDVLFLHLGTFLEFRGESQNTSNRDLGVVDDNNFNSP